LVVEAVAADVVGALVKKENSDVPRIHYESILNPAYCILTIAYCLFQINFATQLYEWPIATSNNLLMR
jgi:hypothetical protein